MFLSLPPEVLEVVFAHLPLFCLLSTCSIVCKQWHSIITQRKFLQWRKLYYKYKLDPYFDKKEEAGSCLELKHPSLINSREIGSLVEVEDALLNLLYICKDRYQMKMQYFSTIVDHPQYSEAKQNMTLTMPNLSDSLPSITAWLTVTSSTVWAVRDVIRHLLKSKSKATTIDVSEFMYMLATMLLFYQREKNLPSRMHYLVFHALYFLENEWAIVPNKDNHSSQKLVKSKSGQQSLMSLGFTKSVPSKVPTAEQLRIIQHPLKKENRELIKIVAFAGTGKTTTLVKLATTNPNMKFLLVVYNRSVKLLAEQIFPKANVVCKTVHQMAMAKCGFLYSKKLTSNLKAKDILDSGLLASNGSDDGSLYRRAGQVLATLTNFMNSPDRVLELENVPSTWAIGRNTLALTTAERAVVLSDAESVWKVMTDKDDMRVRIPHDGYMKVWQIRSPSLQRVTEHDVLLLDEGQDMNPAMLDIFMNQKVSRVIVGDPHQQIYMFRGAVNALDIVVPTHTYYLTQSFRFGPEIAFIANKTLLELKGIDERTLVGGKKRDTFFNIISR